MKNSEIKRELTNLIAKENDTALLETIREVLLHANLDPVLKLKLVSRALRSEENIRDNKLYSRKQIETKLDDILKK